jgi:hypothetical protein
MAPKKPDPTKDQSDQITIPEDLTALSDEELATLHDTAVAAFEAAYPADGSAPDDSTLEALSVLADGIDALKAEVATRDAAALGRVDKAKELASRVLPQDAAKPKKGDDEEDAPAEDPAPEQVPVETPPIDPVPSPAPAPSAESVEQPQAVAASGGGRSKRTININLAGLRNKEQPVPTEDAQASHTRKVGFAAQGAAGFDVGTPVSIADMAESVNSRLGGFNASSYESAASRGRRQNERFTIARIKREFPAEAVVTGEDPKDAMDYATNEKNLPQGSLVASGGWCAPSETLYNLVNISEAENLISIPEIQINRGGIRHTLGPDYRAVFNATGFCYTEAQDTAGNYDGLGGGVKPCTTVPCPGFTDVRLGYCGVCIGAGLLQQRGYPEVIEDYIAKTLSAHAHRVSAAVINSMVAQSDSVVFPGPQAGATAPVLTAVDLQATHYRAINRMADTATLEVVLPTWSKALFRADLARRLGLAEFEVSDARITGWFTNRNVNVQYVVDWQDISTTAASGFTAAPSGVQFLIYAAGTFVKGVTDSITMENIYDSVLLGKNNYTALFTEDPYLVAKRTWDARRVTVPVSPDGATHVGLDIAANGTV